MLHICWTVWPHGSGICENAHAHNLCTHNHDMVAYMHICALTHMHTCLHTHTCTCMHISRPLPHTCMYTCTHMFTPAHMCMCTHSCTCSTYLHVITHRASYMCNALTMRKPYFTFLGESVASYQLQPLVFLAAWK